MSDKPMLLLCAPAFLGESRCPFVCTVEVQPSKWQVERYSSLRQQVTSNYLQHSEIACQHSSGSSCIRQRARHNNKQSNSGGFHSHHHTLINKGADAFSLYFHHHLIPRSCIARWPQRKERLPFQQSSWPRQKRSTRRRVESVTYP